MSDLFVFSEEEGDAEPARAPWKIVVIDDEIGIHESTKLAVKNIKFEDRDVEVISGYSFEDGKKIFDENDDIALALLDVVMEEANSGLKLVEYVRGTVQNKNVRIILRTGMPGQAPVKQSIKNYEIDGYEEKETLTSNKLFSIVVSSIRNYKFIQTISEQSEELAEKAQLLKDQQKEILSLNKELNSINLNLEKQVEEKTVAYNNALLQIYQNEKLTSLGRIVATVSHELKTPLSNVSLACISLEQDIEDLSQKAESSGVISEEVSEYFDDLKIAGQLIKRNFIRANDLINSFKRVSTDQTSGIKKQFNLCEYIEDEILFTIHQKIEKSKLKVNLVKSEELRVTSYPGVINQIFNNLIDNTINHAYDEKGGELTITVEKAESNFRITFEDFGKGIEEGNLDKIFEPFFTTSGLSGEGTGLGLSILYNIVKKGLKGDIRCESELGKGTKFTIEAPIKA